MTAAALSLPPYLPGGGPLGPATVAGRWNAVTVPVAWGHLVLDVLADRSGPVLAHPGTGHPLWPVPAGTADEWPEARAARCASPAPPRPATAT